jgi:bacillithiol synthase
MNLEIRAEPLSGSRLVQDYYAGAPELATFFVGSPWDVAAYRRKMADVDARFSAQDRTHLADAIRTTSPASAASLDEIASGRALVVTTGQQAGLFTGPLYTIHKILSTIQLARTLEPALERRVLPLFWIASDDHDWEEINHLHLLDSSNELRRIEIGSSEARAVPAGERVLGNEVIAALDQLETALPNTEFTRAMALVREAYRPEQTAASAFADLLAALFHEFDLLMVDPRHPSLKKRMAPLLARELANSPEHERRLAAQTARLQQAGYPAQVTVLDAETNVFFENDGVRERLLRVQDGFQLKASGARFAHDEIMERVAKQPERFSPNVFLRPVVESALLPTIAYVGGPAELSYFAQIGCLFRAHSVEMPVVFPRFSVTLIESKVRKVLDKHRLQPIDFRRPIQEVTAQVVREETPPEITAALAELRREWSAGFEGLAELAAGVDPTLKGAVQGARNSGFQQLGEVEKKIAQSLKRQSATTVEQLEKAAVNLFPLGAPQERVLNVVQYLSRYGVELLPSILQEMQVQLEVDAPAWAGVECA